MRNFVPFMIAIVITVFAVTYISLSSQVKESSFRSELTITNAIEAFLDKTTDSGAITHKDYANLNSQLISTGGLFEIVITVSRLLPVPDEAEPGSYVMEYIPTYGWHSSQGGLTAEYQDENYGQLAGYQVTKIPKGVQYISKGDNVQVVVRQVDLMNYQRTLVTRLNQGTNLGVWTRAKATRNTGSAIIENQAGG